MPDQSTLLTPINPYSTRVFDRRGKLDIKIFPSLVMSFTAKVHEIMKENSPDGFRFVVCDDDEILGSGVGGFSRMAIDPPETPAKLEDRLNIASMSKTLTAAAVLSTLQAKNLSPDIPIAPFLPPEWTLHDEVKKLTFRDFLTHRTGFHWSSDPNGPKQDASDYEGMKKVMGEKPYNSSKPYDYRNINFAIFRVVLPYLNSYDRFSKKVTLVMRANSKPDKVLADAYISIVNERILGPSGVSTAGCDSRTIHQSNSEPPLPVLLYEYQQPHKKGFDLGDRTLRCGPDGWSLSVLDYARFLQALLFTEILLSEKNRALMLAAGVADGHGLGINRDDPLAGSEVYSHGAWIPVGAAQVAGWFLYFQSTKLIVVALSNAGHKPGAANWYDRVQQAYTEVYGRK